MRNCLVFLLWLTILPLCRSDVFAASVNLKWTAPGSNGMVGRASQYDIRYSSVPVTEATWPLATKVTNPPVPKPAGNTEYFTITGLLPGATYYVALKAADAVPNWSPLSNVAVKTTCTGVCVGMTGNVDGSRDNVVNLTDLALLLAYLSNPASTITATFCVEEANVDGSAGGIINLSDLSRMISFLSTGKPLATCP